MKNLTRSLIKAAYSFTFINKKAISNIGRHHYLTKKVQFAFSDNADKGPLTPSSIPK